VINTMKNISFILFICFSVTGFSQTFSPAQHYDKGLDFARQGGLENLFKAVNEFEEVLKAEPENIEALKQMAFMNVSLKDTLSARRYNLAAIRLGDKDACRYGVRVLHQSLLYSDTAQIILPKTIFKFGRLRSKSINTVGDLATAASSITTDTREKLHFFLLWCFENMRPDSVRFMEGGAPMDAQTAFTKRRGLCEEFSSITNDFCKAIGIRSVSVYGYTRYPGYRANESLQQFNHVWNMIRIDTGWYVADLLWSITELNYNKSGELGFRQRLQTDYFLGLPGAFIPEHIPGDPAFQFTDWPRNINAFTSLVVGVDDKSPRMKRINDRDSLLVLLRLPPDKYRLRLAERAYVYNPDNPNDLVAELYNYGVTIYNHRNVNRAGLMEAKKYFARGQILAGSSKLGEIRLVGEACKAGLVNIEKRLATSR
jgi:hypothetical protein